MGETARMPADVLTELRAVPGGPELLDALGRRDDVWLVGGAVRDLLGGRSPRDVDLVVAGHALALGQQLGTVHEVHDRFGTVAVVVGDLPVNIATARTESYEAPGALPDVRPASLEEDLVRRDFS